MPSVRRSSVPIGLAGSVVAALLVAPGAAATAAPAADNQAGALRSATAQRGSAGPGSRVTATYAATPPQLSPTEAAARERALARRPQPPAGQLASTPTTSPASAELAQPAAKAPAATAAAPVVFRNSVIPRSGIAGGYSYTSNSQEPSTDAKGSVIFQVGNWYASRSTNGGGTWRYLNPFTKFGSNFCCDQVAIYDAARQRMFWLLQYSDHLVLANASASGTNPLTNWCYYSIYPSWVGEPSTTEIDYNDVAVGSSYVYVASNLFPSSGSGGSMMLRLPAAAMSTCSTVNYNYLKRTDTFTFKPAHGSTSTMYWGSNWVGTLGSSFRVFKWAESSTSYSWRDSTVPGYVFMSRNSGQYCGSADGVVKNWCQFADSRPLGGYRAGGVLGFSFNAKQNGGAQRPYPYTRIVRFLESDLSYSSSSDLWNGSIAIMFLSMARNGLGAVGGTFAWGGGTGSTRFYPGAAVWKQSSFTDPNYYLYGGGNTCTYGSPGYYRWGDYLTARRLLSNSSQWLAAGYAIKGNNCGSPGWYSEPHNVVFQ